MRENCPCRVDSGFLALILDPSSELQMGEILVRSIDAIRSGMLVIVLDAFGSSPERPMLTDTVRASCCVGVEDLQLFEVIAIACPVILFVVMCCSKYA